MKLDKSHAVQSEQSVGAFDPEAILTELASLSPPKASSLPTRNDSEEIGQGTSHAETELKTADVYRTLVEQIPAVVFIAHLDRGISEVYVSPQIEISLGYSQEEWLEDPIRWYERIHPEDKQRWSVDAAELFVKGKPLKSAYRVMARNGSTIWFQCEAKIMRREDGRPWFLHGVGFDITELKQTEAALQARTSALQELSFRLLRSQDEEHRRIARNLHDSLGQYLAALKLNLGKIASSAHSELYALCLETEQIADHCIDETRTVSHLLHPPMLDEIGIRPAAEWYVEGFAKRSKIEVTLDLPSELIRLPAEIEVSLFRTLQEALTNVHRHSGSPTVAVQLKILDAGVVLQIRDHGRGIPPELLERFQKTGTGVGVGLSGMRERINELGGNLEVSSGSGTTLVSAFIPLPARQQVRPK